MNKTDRRDEPKGARSLRQITLDTTRSLIYEDPNAYDIFSSMTWNLQKEVLDGMVKEHKRMRAQKESVIEIIETARGVVPQVDLEAVLSIDPNREAARYPMQARKDTSDETCYDLARKKTLERFNKAGSGDRGVKMDVFLVRYDSGVWERFQICYHYPRTGPGYCGHMRKSHLRLSDFISSELLKQRMRIWFGNRATEVEEDGDTLLVVDETGADGEEYRLYSDAQLDMYGGAFHAARLAITINALLSPIETSEGRQSFGNRAMWLIDPDGEGADDGIR